MEDYLGFYKTHVEELTQRSGAQYSGHCPFTYNHSDGRDNKPSFEVNIDTGQYFCQACEEKGNKHTFCKKLGISTHNHKSNKIIYGPIVATFDYTDESGKLLFQTTRRDQINTPIGEKPDKKFSQRRPNGKGWIYNLKGVKRVPYRLPELLKSDVDQWVFIPEGEKHVDILYKLGFIASCNPMGAGKWPKMASDLNLYFKDRKICILPDNDDPGRKHGQQVAESLYQIAKEIKILKLPGLPKKGDIIDWIAKEHQNGYDNEFIKKHIFEFLNKTKVFERLLPTIDLVSNGKVWTKEGQAELNDTVIVESGRLPWIIDEAEEIFLRKNPHIIFQRSGQLVKITTLDENKEIHGINRQAGAVTISPVEDPHYITDLFGRNVNFIKKDAPIDPPQKIGKTYLSRTGEWRAPILNRIIECPTIRADGSILDKPGYDEATGLYFCNGNTNFLKVKDKPNKDDAIQSIEILKEPFKEFPFIAPEDKSVIMAAVLTAITRQCLRSAPLFGISAPTMGSGKSLSAEIISLIATGRLPANMPQGRDPEEDRKRLLSLLLCGDPIVLMDNCEKPIYGGALCMILTQEIYQDRLLSQNKMARVNTAVTVMATGNNLQFLGDMTTRALLCTIDPGIERPEERSFEIKNIRDFVLKNRPKYIHAALTILKAYYEAEMPSQYSQNIKPYGRFEQWSDLIRSSLVWLDQEDPCKTRFKIDTNDPVQDQLKRFLECWFASYKSTPMTIKHVIDDVANGIEQKYEDSFDLNEVLMEIAGDKDSINPRKLSWFIKKYQGKPMNGLRIVKDENKSGKDRAQWKVLVITRNGV